MSIVCFKKRPAPFANHVLEAFANLQVATVISVLFVYLPIRMEKLGSRRTHFREIL